MQLLVPVPGAPQMRKVRLRASKPSSQGSRICIESQSSDFHSTPGPGSDCHNNSYLLLLEFNRVSCLLKGHHKQSLPHSQPPEHPRAKINKHYGTIWDKREAKMIPDSPHQGCFVLSTADLLLHS